MSAVAYYAAGVRFDASPFPGYMQFIDEELLRERLLESVWYSHAHPPGLNLLVGAAYRVLGDGAPTFLALLFHGLGLVLALGLFALTLRLTGTRVAAYVCTGLVVLSPGFVLYENWLMYTFLEAVLLTTSAVALYQTLDRGSTAWGVALFTALAALVLTRGCFIWAGSSSSSHTSPGRRRIGGKALPPPRCRCWRRRSGTRRTTSTTARLPAARCSVSGFRTSAR